MTARSEPPPRFRHALLVINPIAGRGKSLAAANTLEAGLQAAGIQVTRYATKARGDARQRVAALEGDIDVVVSIGGDGTLAEILETLPHPIPVAMLPMGTANVLGLECKLPREASQLVPLICAGQTMGLDSGWVQWAESPAGEPNERVSFLVTGIGFDGAVVQDVERRRTGPITKLTYVGAVLHALRRCRPAQLSVQADGKLIPGTWAWALITNTRGYGSVLTLRCASRMDDGLFEIVLFPKAGPFALMKYALLALIGRIPGGSCRMVQASHVQVDSSAPAPVQIDGDFAGHTPLEFKVRPGRHQLIIP